jgi:Methyltransferase domain
MNPANFFSRLEWKEDRMLLDGHVYRLQHFDGPWTGQSDHFVFYKTRELVEQYRIFFEEHPGFSPQTIFEIGLWDGGSMVFWSQLFQPAKHVGVDIQNKQNSPCFQRYLAQEHVRHRVKPYWAVDQQDAARLRQIWQTEFNKPLDLVIDDASHMHAPTRASFEALFPRLRPGGLYIIEDWAWGHWGSFLAPDHPWAAERPLTELILELMEAVGTGRGMIRRLQVFQGFVVVERGEGAAQGTFSLDAQILRRKTPLIHPNPRAEAAPATKEEYA